MNDYLSYTIIILLIALIAWMRIKRIKKNNRTYRRMPEREFPDAWRKILEKRVLYYQRLSSTDKHEFINKVHIFLVNFEIKGVETEVTDLDRVLVAAGATIPVFRIPTWHYKKLAGITIFPDRFRIPNTDQEAHGLSGWGYMEDEVWFSRKAIYQGFHVDDDAKNVVIHEFVHKMDMQDNIADGLIDELMTAEDKESWKTIARDIAIKIQEKRSSIREYAITNPVEFLAATTEYYFESPSELRSEHPKLYRAIENIYIPSAARFSYH